MNGEKWHDIQHSILVGERNVNVEKWHASGLFTEYQDKQFDPQLGNYEAWETVQGYIGEIHARTPHGLLFSGPTGVGKTLLAHDVARVVIERPGSKLRAVRFDKYCQNISRLMTLADTMKVFPEAAAQWAALDERMREYEKVRWLLLDDVGSEYSTGSDWIPSHLTMLLRQRGDVGHPTFITTNLNDADWKARYGERLDSYVRQVYTVVPMVGKDGRR